MVYFQAVLGVAGENIRKLLLKNAMRGQIFTGCPGKYWGQTLNIEYT